MPFLHWTQNGDECYTRMDLIGEVVVFRDENGELTGLRLIPIYENKVGGEINDPVEAYRVLALLQCEGNLLSSKEVI